MWDERVTTVRIVPGTNCGVNSNSGYLTNWIFHLKRLPGLRGCVKPGIRTTAVGANYRLTNSNDSVDFYAGNGVSNMNGLSRSTRFGALALIVAVGAASWFAHRGNAFTLIESPPQHLSGLVSLTASQGIRANVFNRSDQPVSAEIKFWDANGNTVGTPTDVVVQPSQALSLNFASLNFTSVNPSGAAPTVGDDGTLKIRVSVTITGSNPEEENANLDALIGLVEIFNARDGATTVALPMTALHGSGGGAGKGLSTIGERGR